MNHRVETCSWKIMEAFRIRYIQKGLVRARGTLVAGSHHLVPETAQIPGENGPDEAVTTGYQYPHGGEYIVILGNRKAHLDQTG